MGRSLHLLRGWLPRSGGLPQETWDRRHRVLTGLLTAHVPALVVFALLRFEGPGLAHAIGEALIPAVAAAAAHLTRLSRRARSVLVSMGLLSCSGLLVHFSGGLIEMHFHFFVMIALMTLYHDWVPYLVAIGFVATHHGVVGVLDPGSVYNHPAAIAHPWRWALIHAGFVLGASIVNVVTWKVNQDALRRERKAAEQLRAVNDMKDAFLAAVSHELRTPLTSVLGSSITLDQAWDSLSTADARDLVRAITCNARRLDGLLTDLLDVDRLQRDALQPDRRYTDLAELVRRVAGEVAERTGRCVTAEGDVLVASVDGPKVERIVENLIGNAAKYSTGPIAARVERAPAGVLITVDDEGPGVPDEAKDRIFEPFRRGPYVRVHAPGTGIGLALVARFAELHSGRAWVEDRSDGGSSFRVFLPAGVQATEQQGLDARAATAS